MLFMESGAGMQTKRTTAMMQPGFVGGAKHPAADVWAVRGCKATTADAARRGLSEGQSTLQLMLMMLARLGQRRK